MTNELFHSITERNFRSKFEENLWKFTTYRVEIHPPLKHTQKVFRGSGSEFILCSRSESYDDNHLNYWLFLLAFAKRSSSLLTVDNIVKSCMFTFIWVILLTVQVLSQIRSQCHITLFLKLPNAAIFFGEVTDHLR